MSFGTSLWLRGATALVAVAAITLFAGVARGQTPPSSGAPTAEATPSTTQEVRLDLLVKDGDKPCAEIEDQRTVHVGDEFKVAVCLLNAPEPPAVVTFSVLYDDRVVLAPNVGACDGVFGKPDNIFATVVPGSVAGIDESLDCNPDANAGKTIFGDAGLGGGWDCTSGGAIEPWGNRPPPTGNAFNGGCISAAGPYTLPPNAPVAMITFKAVAPGGTALTPELVSITGASGVETGTCQPVIDTDMRCEGGLIKVAGESPTPTADVSGSDSSDFPLIRVAVVAGFAALAIVGALLFVLARRRRDDE